MPAPDIILELIERFERNRSAYRSTQYNEAQLRLEFLHPFFEALGWDMTNRQGYAEAYKDVIHEDAIRIGEAVKAPDYAFRIGGTRKFFVEAKKPSVNLKDDISPAYQLRRYAWSARLPLSILTDFEEFAVYDCRDKPDKNDKASTGRVMYFDYRAYPERWDEVADIFQRDAILKGSFDRYAASTRAKHGTAEVDDAFLAEIERWRELLARNLALRNPGLTQRELNYAVQMTIDRVLFLRIGEDRGAELYGGLLALLNGEHVYERLLQLFRRADERYNSGLFHFRPEKGAGHGEAPDTLTPTLQIDDKALKDILRNLYYPDSPYVFSQIPADILGQVYERFLGKVIRLTAGHHAVVEEKPEVKKAGGVYYTPTYIVQYIVRQTVGALLEGRQLGEAGVGGKGAPLRVLDPACGSGSFLLGAFQYLLDWYRDGYVAAGAEKWAKGRRPTLYQAAAGEWRLTTAERKRILLDHIYGVDIDPQAVEVTKLSLLLKVLEGENEQTINTQLSFFQERVLPDLANNIQCGNSLIGPDFYDGAQPGLFDDDERYRVNAFDWEAAFPQAFAAGGFDAVIGNPPYGASLFDVEKKYFKSKYVCQSYQLDSYLLFLEQAVRTLLRKSGFFGMIIPNPWLTNILQTNTRKFVVDNVRVIEIVHFQFPVFSKVVVDTQIVILQKDDPVNWKPRATVVESQDAFLNPNLGYGILRFTHNQDDWRNAKGDVINIFLSELDIQLFHKCKTVGMALETYFFVNVGIKPYQVGKGVPPQTKAIVNNRPFDSNYQTDNSYRQYLRGSDIGRFRIKPLESRYIKYGPWLAEPRPAANFDAPIKILMRQTGDSLVATLDTYQYLCLNNMHVLVPKQQDGVFATYALGIINSRLLNWYYHALNPEVGEALAEVKKTNVANLPIRPINFSIPADVMCYTHIASLVESMLSLHRQHAAARTPQEQTALQRQIEATDRQIDALVYELYGLSQDEIAIVEGRG
jgi:type I restriction-modification system DNA methylase subunit